MANPGDKIAAWRSVYSEVIGDDEEFVLHARGTLTENTLEALEEFCGRQRKRLETDQGVKTDG